MKPEKKCIFLPDIQQLTRVATHIEMSANYDC